MNIRLNAEDKQRLQNGEKLFLAKEGREQFTIIAKDKQEAQEAAEMWNAVVIKEIIKYKIV